MIFISKEETVVADLDKAVEISEEIPNILSVTTASDGFVCEFTVQGR